MKQKIKLLVIIAVVVAAIVALKLGGVFDMLTLDNMAKLREWILSYGALGPIIYIAMWIAACIFFLPGLPVALVGGIAFGPLWGTVYSSIGSTIGATCAFLIARYAARGMVEGWVAGNEQFKKIDDGVKRQAWRMLMVTRLVPAFPFNLQNYAYGLTNVKLSTYAGMSWLCMIPGAAAFSFAGGSISSGGNLTQIFIYLGVAAVFFVLLSLIPGWIKKRRSQ